MKIYLSPSRQPANTYAYGGTNEEREMNRLAANLKVELERYETIEAKIGGFDLSVMDLNTRDKFGTLRPERVVEAHNYGADIVLVLHTNASGSPEKQLRGTQVYITKEDAYRRSIGTKIVNAMEAITPWTANRGGVFVKAFTEAKHYEALGMAVLYVEVEFHDTTEPARWIIENIPKIASVLAEAVCTYHKKTLKQPATDTTSSLEPSAEKTVYRIQVASFPTRNDADNYLPRVKKYFPSAYVQPSKVRKSNAEIVDEVINGRWGNGETRIKLLTDNYYDAATINKLVTEKLRR